MKIFYLIILVPFFIHAQVGIGTTMPNAALDINANNDGLLIPRVALVNTTTATVVTPTISELVYNTATAGNVTPGFYFWDGGKWVRFGNGETTPSGGWQITGNAGTVAETNFLGTTDDVDLIFKRNNMQVGKLNSTNISFGVNALSPTTTGVDNTAIGLAALQNNTNGSNNIANGSYALLNNTMGANNVVHGYEAMKTNTTGFDNIASGFRAMLDNISGYYNVAIGSSALVRNTYGRGNEAIGYKTMLSNTTGSFNVAIGDNAIANNTTGSQNIGIGPLSLNNNSTGSNNIAIGYNTQIPIASTSNQVRIGNSSVTYAGVQVAWSVTSDSRWKENIKSSNLGLNFINDLKPVYYNRKNDNTKKVEYGIIAQELETSLQKFGADTNGIITKDEQGMYSVRYNDLIAPMIKAIQEQQVMIQEQQKIINELKTDSNKLKKQ